MQSSSGERPIPGFVQVLETSHIATLDDHWWPTFVYVCASVLQMYGSRWYGNVIKRKDVNEKKMYELLSVIVKLRGRQNNNVERGN